MVLDMGGVTPPVQNGLEHEHNHTAKVVYAAMKSYMWVGTSKVGLPSSAVGGYSCPRAKIFRFP